MSSKKAPRIGAKAIDGSRAEPKVSRFVRDVAAELYVAYVSPIRPDANERAIDERIELAARCVATARILERAIDSEEAGEED